VPGAGLRLRSDRLIAVPLQWLGIKAPSAPLTTRRERLTPQELKPACDRMARSFWDESGELRWSGGLVDSAIGAVAEAAGGPPEPFLLSLWAELRRRELTEQTHQLCRQVGRVTLGNFRRDPHWDLSWMTATAQPAQACLRYWTIGVKPELWTDALEQQTMLVLARYPFKF
jgi:hypothetical protein